MNGEFLLDLFEGLVTPENIIAAYDEMKSGANGSFRYDYDKFELRVGEVHATISLHLDEGIETFKCDCGYEGKGFCKHFIYLFTAAREAIYRLDDERMGRSYPAISTLESKIRHSKYVSLELRTSFKEFEKQYISLYKAWARQINAPKPSKRAVRQAENAIYDVRNDFLTYCLGLARNTMTQNGPQAALEVSLYCVFNFCGIVGYDDKERLFAVMSHFSGAFKAFYRKSKAVEKEQIWLYISRALDVKNTDKLPEMPILEMLAEFLFENYKTKKDMTRNLIFLDDVIHNALVDDNEVVLEFWVVEKMWLLQDTDISSEDYYSECRNWWNFVPVRLNYLEYCMANHEYHAARTIATECLTAPDQYDEDEIISLHRILLGASFKLDRYDQVVKEAEYLVKNSPDILFFDLQYYMKADRTRWPKISARVNPLIKKSKRNK